MKRFWTTVTVEGGVILLDGKPVRTPGYLPLIIPYAALAEAIAAEWRGIESEINPRAMPLTGLANAAIEQITPDPAAFANGLATYAETDLLCYRADAPPELVARQADIWDPLLGWAQARFDIAFTVATGIIHKTQLPETVRRLAAATLARGPFDLAGLSPLVTIGGSLIVALMIAERAIAPEPAFDACHLDELWQAQLWGEDWAATDAREARRRDYLSAARFLELVSDTPR